MSNETDAEIVNRLILKKKKQSNFVVDRFTTPPTLDELYTKQEALRRQQGEESESNHFVNAYSVKEVNNHNLQKAAAENHLSEKGWSRYPNPHECFYFEADCCYGCGKKVAYLTPNSPNIGEENYPKSTPLDLSQKDSYGNFNLRHSCIGKTATKELQYIIRRIEAAEEQNRLLRNRVTRQNEIINQNTRRF